MKRYLMLLLALTLTIALTACGAKVDSTATETPANIVPEQPADQAAPAEETAAEGFSFNDSAEEEAAEEEAVSEQVIYAETASAEHNAEHVDTELELIEVESGSTIITLWDDEVCSIDCWGPKTGSRAYTICFEFQNNTADTEIAFYVDNLSIQGVLAENLPQWELGDGVEAFGLAICNAGSGSLSEFSVKKSCFPGLELAENQDFDTITFTIHAVDAAVYPDGELVSRTVTLHYND